MITILMMMYMMNSKNKTMKNGWISKDAETGAGKEYDQGLKVSEETLI